jgi:hypothetical protein
MAGGRFSTAEMDAQIRAIKTELRALTKFDVPIPPARQEALLARLTHNLAEESAYHILNSSMQEYATVEKLTGRAIEAQRRQIAALQHDAERWAEEISTLKEAMAANEKILFAARKSLVSLEAYADGILRHFHPQSNLVFREFRRHSKVRGFDFLIRGLAVDFERGTGKRATLVTRTDGMRGSPFLRFVERYLNAFAKDEGVEWPFNKNPEGNRSALAERVHRALYRKQGPHKRTIQTMGKN